MSLWSAVAMLNAGKSTHCPANYQYPRRAEIQPCFYGSMPSELTGADASPPGSTSRETLDAAEFFEEGGFAALADAGEFVEDAFGNALEPKLGVVGVSEAMRFVADALEKF